MNNIHKKLILMDLDGVLNEYKGEFDKNYIPKIKKGAKKFLTKLSQKYEVKIFTTRNKLLTSKWLIENNLDSYILDVTNIKELASFYIDDRCICFQGNYNDLYKQINSFQTFWK